MSHRTTYWEPSTDNTSTNIREYDTSYTTPRDTMTSQYKFSSHDDPKNASLGERFDSGVASMSIPDEGIESISEESLRSTSMCIHDDSANFAVESSQRPKPDNERTHRPTDSLKDEGLAESITSIGYESLKESELSIPELKQEATEETKTTHADTDEICQPFIPFPETGGFSSLHIAILDKEREKAMDYIESCPHPDLLNFFTTEIHTALHLSVYANLPDIVRFLVVYGADLNFKDKRGNTPLHTACELGRLSCVKMLLSPLDAKESCGMQKIKPPQDINEKNYEGLTPLHLATINDQSKIVDFLLRQQGIDINVGDSSYGRTALHHALERRNKECFYLLLRTSVNVNATTYDGCAPLHLSVGLGMEQETRSLVTRGANAYIETNNTRVWDLAKTQRLKDALQYSSLQVAQRAEKQR